MKLRYFAEGILTEFILSERHHNSSKEKIVYLENTSKPKLFDEMQNLKREKNVLGFK